MRRFALTLIPLLVLPLAGCKPAGRALASLQYRNIHLRLVKSVMTMTIGDGSVDLRRLMRQEVYVGKVVSGHVTAEYPEGLEGTAAELAKAFDAFYPVVQQQLGVEWSFDIILKLVRVDAQASGYRYSVKLGKERILTFPIPVRGDVADPNWTPVVAHEMTESSMLAPKKRSGLVLADLYADSFCISTGTRWFRDGVSDYAECLFAGQLPPGSAYADLNRVRDRLLSWSNCKGEPDWYNAATGLMFEITGRYGGDAIVRIMKELSKESVPGGCGLARAFRRAAGTDLREFLRNYETPWAGLVIRDAGSTDSGVHVTKVYPATPASRRGIKPGDVIVSFAGQPVTSADGFANILARQRTWELVPIEVRRGDQLIPMRLKLIPMPADIGLFLRLSGATDCLDHID